MKPSMKKVMIFGTFDILHAGHLHMFQEAREYGDHLIAIVSQDETTLDVKGNTPFHTHAERKEFLEAIRTIDTVISGKSNDMYAVIAEQQPDIIALGYDQQVFVDELANKITEFGMEIEIVRLQPYKPHDKKTTKIKQYLQKCC